MGYLRRIKNRERRVAKATNIKRNNTRQDGDWKGTNDRTNKRVSVRSRLRRAAKQQLIQAREAQEQKEANVAAQEMADYKEVNDKVRENPEAYEKFLENEGIEVPEMFTETPDDVEQTEEEENNE